MHSKLSQRFSQIFIVINVARAVPSGGPALADCDSADDDAEDAEDEEDEEDVPRVCRM